jgi:hypothetical protein
VVAEVRERLAVSKREAQKIDVEKCNRRKLRELEIGKQYQINISNRFAALEILSDSEDVIGAGKTLKGTSKPKLKRI